MDVGSFSSSRSAKKPRSMRCRYPLQEVGAGVVYIPPMAATGLPFKNPLTRQTSGGDRFIPDRSAMDFDVAHYLLTERRREKENGTPMSPAKEAYQRLLADTLMPNRSRILAFKSKPPAPSEGVFWDTVSDNVANQMKSVKKQRYIPQSAERTLDAPEIMDDYYLNLLDWGSSNVLSIALGNTVYLWNASDGSTSELMSLDEDNGPVTSVSWAPDGRHVAIGLNSSDVQLRDTSSNRLVA